MRKLSPGSTLQLVILLAGLLTSTALCQGLIQGKLTDAETGQPIALGNVVVQGTTRGDATDQSGEFVIDGLQPGLYTLVITSMGYQAIEKNVKLEAKPVVVLVELQPILLRAPTVTIVSDRTAVVGRPGNLFDIPGAAHLITKKVLKIHSYSDIHRILREVPGMNIQEEDGFGNRPNIGMRGTGGERSQKIALMEDGVLIAPAPYSAPSAYYFPTAGRMESVEVRKGSSQIKYGPNTNGGALNMISTSIPAEFTIYGILLSGSYNLLRAHVYLGNSTEHFGWLIETHQISSGGFKLLDNGSNTGFNKRDYLAKFRLNSSSVAQLYQALEFKVSRTDEVSHETYLGLTDADFSTTPFRRYMASQRDRLDADHSQFQVRYFVRPSPTSDVTTIVYQNNFFRNWYKLDRLAGDNITSVLANPDANMTAFYLLSASDSEQDQYHIKANQRTYFGRGIQSILNWRVTVADVENEIEISVRYHEDEEDRFQHVDKFQMVSGNLVLTTPGKPGSQDNRIGSARAVSWYLRDKINYGAFTIIPGVRTEDILIERTDYNPDDPDRQVPPDVYTNNVSVVIPGLGVTYRINSGLNSFVGIHKGFSPPGPSKSGDSIKAEESVNLEIGLKFKRAGSTLNGLMFLNRYDNMLGADLLATGGEGTGDEYNAGQVVVFGVELAGQHQFKIWNVNIPLKFSYTYAAPKFMSDFASEYQPWGHVQIGDKLPYVAPHQFYAEGSLKASTGYVSISAKYTSAMRTQAGQGPVLDSESVGASLIFDLAADYRILDNTWLQLKIRNITDQTYIVSRRPAGVRPGLPRTLVVGVNLDL